MFRKSSFQPVPCKTREGEILLQRFKLGTTQLRCDLFRVNVVDDPHCIYCQNVIEDYHHFFLECSLYNNLRPDLLGEIFAICPDFQTLRKRAKIVFILNGSDECNKENITKLMHAVEKYIVSSKRF